MIRRSNLVFGTALISVVILAALVGMLWTPHDPHSITGARAEAPSPQHWLGTDGGGFDIVSRLMTGARLVLLIGVVSVVGAAAIGIPAGIVAGMSRGWAGKLIARGSDILYGFPALLLAILFAAALGGSAFSSWVMRRTSASSRR